LDTNAISYLVPTLNLVWPSNNGNNQGFWAHEWEKHGTCSEFSQLEYFEQSINLQIKNNVKSALATSWITPSSSNTYFSSSIIQAVKTSNGATPVIHCSGNLLTEVGICLQKSSLNVMDCPDSINANNNYWSCPNSVSFATNVPESAYSSETYSESENGSKDSNEGSQSTFKQVVVAVLIAAIFLWYHYCGLDVVQ